MFSHLDGHLETPWCELAHAQLRLRVKHTEAGAVKIPKLCERSSAGTFESRSWRRHEIQILNSLLKFTKVQGSGQSCAPTIRAEAPLLERTKACQTLMLIRIY